MKKKLYTPAILVLSTLCFTGCSQAKDDGYLPDKTYTNVDASGRPLSLPTVSQGPEDKTSIYNATPSAGTGVKASEDAGDPNTAPVVNMLISPDELMVKAGINLQFNGKGFAPNSKVSVKVVSTNGKDAELTAEPATVAKDGTLASLKLYIPKNFTIGGYTIEFSDGTTAVQKAPLNIVAGF